jgi:type I restriction enzyme S subunit
MTASTSVTETIRQSVQIKSLVREGMLIYNDGYRTKASELNSCGLPILRVSQINEGRIVGVPTDFIDPAYDQKIGAKKSQIGDVVLTTKGTIGRIARIKDKTEMGYAYSPQVIWSRATHSTLSKFLFYALQSRQVQNQLRVLSEQTDMAPYVNLHDYGLVEIPLPAEQEQEAIAEVLSSLDDKIDLLKRQNKTLEGMAEALFRKWFIEEAQDDWEEVSIDQVGIFLNGLACQKHRPTTYGSLPVLKIRDLRNGLTEDSDRACANVDPKYIVEAGDLIFSWSGTLEVKIWDGERCVLNQHLFKVTSEDFPRWYLLLWCQHHLAQWRATAEAHATTMGHIKRSDLKAAMVPVPSDYELSKMDEKMGGIMARIDLNNSEMKGLVKQRDTLLPRLMSGEVRVQMD